MKIRGTKIGHLLRLLYSDTGYIFLNTVVNHIPVWSIRKAIYKMSGISIGRNSRIGIGSIIVFPKGICLGNGCIINEYCHLDGRGGLFIDHDVSISIYTKLITASHNLESNHFEFRSEPIHIHDHSFIGAGSIVLEGTTIEKGCVIGAGSVIKGHYEANSYYIGNPAKRMRTRECDYSYSLKHEAFFR